MFRRFICGPVCCAVFLCVSGASVADDIGIRIGPGGAERMVRGKWGIVKALLSNKSDLDKEVLAVVIPEYGNGMQYSRRVIIPSKTHRICQWPVLIPEHETSVFNFEYLLFDDAEGEGPVKREFGEQITRDFSVINPETRTQKRVGYRGLLVSDHETERDRYYMNALADTLRIEAGYERMGLTLRPDHIDGYPESLESMEQLLISSRTLHHYPDVCDAVRVWTQRGGRTWLLLDQTGMDTVHALLGDALSLTRIDETSMNSVKLEINPEESLQRHRQREVVREFDEPVRLVRVVVEGGSTIWSIDGWPAVIELQMGLGKVIVTTISPEVFVQIKGGRKTLPCANHIAAALFQNMKTEPRISDEKLGLAAAGYIGYSVPSRGFAGIVMLGFAGLLSVAGFLLLSRDQAASMLWTIPLLALLCAAPAAWIGSRSRSVAPPTAVQQQLIHHVKGQSTLAADGLTSIFQPSPAELSIRMKDFSLLIPSDLTSEVSDRRIVWTDRGEAEWFNLSQPAGVRNYKTRTLRRLERPGKINATFDGNGLTGLIDLSDDIVPTDAILAGTSADRMLAHVENDGTFRVGPEDLLASTEYVSGTILSDVQKRHASIYAGLFSIEKQDVAYPSELTLLYWTRQLKPPITVGDESTRQEGSVLITQPIRLQPPPVNEQITIPTTLLPYRVVIDERGGMSGAYSNRNRTWQQREQAGRPLLEFRIPDVCQPFHASGATLDIRISAGSRQVSVFLGSQQDPKLLETLSSPAGLVTLDVPAEHLNPAVAGGSVFVRMEIGEADLGEDATATVSERDDYWSIDRVLLTLRGARTQ